MFCQFFILVKGTDKVISSVLFAMAMPDSQRYLYKFCLIKYELDINVYNFEQLFFQLWFLTKSDIVHSYVMQKT